MHEGLPVPGYKPQSQSAVDIVKEFKMAEERILRVLDSLKPLGDEVDQRWLAIGRTDLEKAFMAINRSIFKPTRIALLEDAGTNAKA